MSRGAAIRVSPTRLRCAIYTRKSSEEGLEQGFNSLHAQREACEAYVLSQAGEGWEGLKAHYDDGGFSGGSLDRPGLAQLLADIDAGQIDVVVVYKVDRLTRSLADFAKIVERFDARSVSFVSVTQAFNTTSSMGRLTLNVLLSFAQFEREVTGERIRDKIAASKAKGLWMGGNIPLGYDPKDRTLVVNPVEAEQVRHIFRRYLELGSVHALRDELEVQGILSKVRVSGKGNVHGGKPFGRGALFHLLANRLYLGEIVHKDQTYPGLHGPIIDVETFEAVQRQLKLGDRRRGRIQTGDRPAMPLQGRIFDDRGNPMSPVSQRKGSRAYRYYVSSALLSGERARAGSLPRFPAPALEELIAERLERLRPILASEVAPDDTIRRIEVARDRVVVRLERDTVDPTRMAQLDRLLAEGDEVADGDRELRLTIAARLQPRGGAKVAIGPRGTPAIHRPRVDATLFKALVRAEAWKSKLLSDGVATLDVIIQAEGVDRGYAQRVIRLAFLAPGIKRAILDGQTPTELTLQSFVRGGVPMAWQDQRGALGPSVSWAD